MASSSWSYGFPRLLVFQSLQKDCLGAQAGHRSVVSVLVSLAFRGRLGAREYRRIVHVVVYVEYVV